MACQRLHLWQAVVAFPGSGSSVRAGVKTLRLSPPNFALSLLAMTPAAMAHDD